MRAEQIVQNLLEADWQPVSQKALCHHNWMTTATDEAQPGMKIITQTCPHCGKQRVLHRRVLPKLPKAPMTQRPPKSKCKHIWIGKGPTQEDPVAGVRKYTLECPKCGYLKTTTRRMLPPLT